MAVHGWAYAVTAHDGKAGLETDMMAGDDREWGKGAGTAGNGRARETRTGRAVDCWAVGTRSMISGDGRAWVHEQRQEGAAGHGDTG